MIYSILSLLILLIIISIFGTYNESFKDPCKDYLSDNEYLEHMIPHHQVAIDMSKELIKVTKNPIMIDFCRKIIWQQEYEIQMMSSVMNKLPNKFNQFERNKLKNYQKDLINYSDKTKLNLYYPKLSKALDYHCDPNFFDPDAHHKHMEGMELTDKSYLEHMIPHHQVAVDMSNRLLKYTKNIHMIDLATTIIREQQFEILKMNEMLKNMKSWDYQSKLFH